MKRIVSLNQWTDLSEHCWKHFGSCSLNKQQNIYILQVESILDVSVQKCDILYLRINFTFASLKNDICSNYSCSTICVSGDRMWIPKPWEKISRATIRTDFTFSAPLHQEVILLVINLPAASVSWIFQDLTNRDGWVCLSEVRLY